ncbi:hypothetical protein W97_08457 [Coniosporium apollinis CBS 100218]|uniref:Uncharacterized protein n=1 Tax=Coniosporium apollinis (strain CBS 100218) TaxID=1168221 RepID=R7Z547_CONA1|nr:uncharacterized protein W97_08457 [Coniosporium apollinis CBS 100218]EON69297.1 hypothetical protein W97_08457 [Coniosporium apollinis CBS 100218]
MSSYHGWDMEEMKAAQAARDNMERGPKRRKTASATSPSTSFTPINISSNASHPPWNGSKDLLRNPTTRDAILRAHPSRNPLVARYLGLDDNLAAQPPVEVHPEITGIEAVTKAAVRKRAPRSKQKANTKRPVSDGTHAAKPRKKATHEKVASDVIDFGYQPPRMPKSQHVDVPNSRSSFPNGLQAENIGYTLSKRIISELDASRPQSLSTPGSYGSNLESESAPLPCSDRVPVIAHVTSLDAVKAQQGTRCSVYMEPSQPESSLNLLQKKSAGTRLADGIPSRATDASLAAQSNPPIRRRDDLLQDSERGAYRVHDPLEGTRSQSEPVRPLAHLPHPRVLEVIEELPEVVSPSPPDSKPGLRNTQSPAGLAGFNLEARNRQVLSFEPSTTNGSAGLDDFDADVDDEDLLQLAARCHTPDLTEAESLPDLTFESCESREQGTIQQLPTPLPSSSSARGVPVPAACDDSMDWTPLVDSDDAEFLKSTQDLEVNPTAPEQYSAAEPAKATSKRQMRVHIPRSSSMPSSASPPDEVPTQLGESNSSRPIVRPPFPCQVQDRSPIICLSATSVLRTCFRAGEALNIGCQAVREGRTVIIELYATVRSSFREPDTVTQHFVIGDLFHDRPPYINAVYELWKGVDLWDYDSSRFLEQSDARRMCRCIGQMKRDDRKWKLLILNIWEASWEDIDYVKDIICT